MSGETLTLDVAREGFTHSGELGELAAALSTAQGEFEAVAKTAANPFFKSSYAPLPEVVEAATPILVENGLSVAQLPGHDDKGHTLTTVLLHKSGQFLASTMRLKPVKDDPQGLGSAITYGRRYAYMAAIGLVADEDDDGNAGSGRTQQQAKPKPKSSRAPKSEAKKPPAAKADKGAGNPDEADLKATVTPSHVGVLRKLMTAAGWSPDKVRLSLVSVGVQNADDIGAAIQGLSLEQAIKLAGMAGGSGEDLIGV